MLNQLVIVGRMYEELKIEKENGKRKAYLILKVPRNYKNANGEYDFDYVEFEIIGSMINNLKGYCHVEDLVGIKGRVQSTLENGKCETKLIAERITFLNTKKKKEA